jgi:hypothetical protein
LPEEPFLPDYSDISLASGSGPVLFYAAAHITSQKTDPKREQKEASGSEWPPTFDISTPLPKTTEITNYMI